MRIFLAFAFASFGIGFLAGDTLSCEENNQGEKASTCVSELDSNCNVTERKEVIPGML